MNLSECLTLFAVVLNIITLVVVYTQTKIAKKSFDISAESYNKDKQIKEITLLPKMHFLIHTKIRFDKWIMTLTQIKNELEVFAQDGNDQALKQISEESPECNGLVDRYMYENSPDWLAQLYMSGAKHYFNSMSCLKGLWDIRAGKGNLYMIKHDDGVEDLIDRFNESIGFVEKLNEYIKDAIPDVILSTPESISDESFLSEK